MLYRLIVSFVIATVLIHAAGPMSAAPADDGYFELKKTGRYAEALDGIRKSTGALDDPVRIEVNIFRIRELMTYPELYGPGLEALRAMEVPAERHGPFLRDRIDIVRNLLLLKKGDLHASDTIQKDLSYMDFQAMGPFANTSADEFERSYPPETGYDAGQTCAGKLYPVSWFRAVPDRTGSIAFNDLFPDTRGSFFYLYRTVEIPEPGEYLLIMGKTGHADLWLDGTRIFSDRTEHAFDHDQYFIRVHCTKGAHRILLKAGDSHDGVRISMRISAAGGRRISAAWESPAAVTGTSELRGISFFPALADLMKIREPAPDDHFAMGYLFTESGLGAAPDNRALRCLSAVPERHRLFSSACYYIAKKAEGPETRDSYLKKSLEADPRNLEAVRDLACLKISRDFLYEAYPLVQDIARVRPRSHWEHECMARLFIKKGWTVEAARHASALAGTPYPSLGHLLEASIHRAEGDYRREAEDLELLMRLDHFDISLCRLALSCYERTGDFESAERLLAGAAAVFPNAVSLTLMLAEITETRRGAAAALPYLASVHAKAPGNRDVLLAHGMAYRQLGRRELALHWLGLASRHDPENHELARYIKALSGEERGIERYSTGKAVLELAADASPYREEPAVVLLDENVISVNMDGSFERLVHKIVMVNAQSEIQNYSTRYIVLDPDTESVESLSCAVVRGLARTEISERYRKHLSDPESRLYYNLEALVLPIATLAPGDIIDLRYIIKNRGGEDYRNYFGERITIGDSLRTILSRTVLVHSADKPVYCRLKRIDASLPVVEKTGQKIVHRLEFSNIAPYRKETAMPHDSEVLPAVYFTTLRTWDDFHAWYTSLLRNSTRVDGDMKEVLKSLISAGDQPMDMVRKIHAYVTGEIRYVGFEFGVGGIRPRSTDTTFHTKMGDCKDMSLLLVAFLRETGIDARLALVRTRDRGTAYLPSSFAGEFNHAICYVGIGGGFFLDPTASSAGSRELPADDRDVEAFVLDESGWRFINTGSAFYYPDIVEVRNSVTISEAGSAVITRTLMKQGSLAAAARYSLRNPSRHLAELNEYWNAAYPGSSAAGLEAESAGTDEPVRYRYTVSAPGHSQVGGGMMIFNAFLTTSDLYRGYATAKNRRFPVMLPGAWTARTSTSFSLPEGFRADRVPSNERYDHGKFSATFTYSTSGDAVTAESAVEIKASRVDPGDYRHFREFTRFIDRKERERIVLVRR